MLFSLFLKVCFVGQTRCYPAVQQSIIDKQVDDFITARTKAPVHSVKIRTESDAEYHTQVAPSSICEISDSCDVDSHNGSTDLSSKDRQWSENFKARSSMELVRNCTQLDSSIISEITNTVGKELLKRGGDPIFLEDGRTWNPGGMRICRYKYKQENQTKIYDKRFKSCLLCF